MCMMARWSATTTPTRGSVRTTRCTRASRRHATPGCQFEFRHSQRTNALGLLEYDGATPVDMIHGAIRALPERCVRQGRCPHKGFNLNQVPVVHGVRICPLHGMRFCARTGKGVPYRNTKDITEEWLLQNDAKL